MNLSPLQKARYEYQPKLPGMLRNGIAEICVKEGASTQSVADQDKIQALEKLLYPDYVDGMNTNDCAAPDEAYTKVIDVKSWAKFWLINEIIFLLCAQG